MTKDKKETPVVATPEKIEEAPKFQLAGFDISDFKSQADNSNISIKKSITNIPVKKPNGQQYFRVHPELEYTVDCIKWKDETDRLYLLLPSMVQVVLEQAFKFSLHLGMYLSSRSIFLFPVQLPKTNEKWNTWHEAQAECVDRAKTQWIRMEASRDQGGYIVHEASGDLEEPEWPEKTIEECIAIGFKSHTIIDEDHSIIKQLRGL